MQFSKKVREFFIDQYVEKLVSLEVLAAYCRDKHQTRFNQSTFNKWVRKAGKTVPEHFEITDYAGVNTFLKTRTFPFS